MSCTGLGSSNCSKYCTITSRTLPIFICSHSGNATRLSTPTIHKRGSEFTIPRILAGDLYLKEYFVCKISYSSSTVIGSYFSVKTRNKTSAAVKVLCPCNKKRSSSSGSSPYSCIRMSETTVPTASTSELSNIFQDDIKKSRISSSAV